MAILQQETLMINEHQQFLSKWITYNVGNSTINLSFRDGSYVVPLKIVIFGDGWFTWIYHFMDVLIYYFFLLEYTDASIKNTGILIWVSVSPCIVMREHKSVYNTILFIEFRFPNVLRATTACTFWTSQLPKVLQEWCVLRILTSKCASCHSGVHFLNISTALGAEFFFHFDIKMRFAPQQRAIFDLSCDQMAPHPPLYFSALRSHKTLEGFAAFLPFRAPWSSVYWVFLFSDCSHLCCFICPSEVWLLNFLWWWC